ncbi:tetratricopeptide repeat protein [Asanoa sp. WMMD1127]|uniref:ATP-binding protein n=1 Tax=Asanoa sp. WMMD1127 TaxID=3016107 RepID=UPI002418038D|nr:helix-turn-helix domain-containing protein [Asanoa sp. WMMD1127]MDG4825046.1 tetratricopeptide repeat protein [Asanoa sp. WMMD1127]
MTNTFAVLLRRHRLDRQLTQEQLAERAGISGRSVGDMERGPARSPRPRTVERLAAALDLTGEAREEFTAAAHQLFWANRPGQSHPSGDVPHAASSAGIRPRHLPADLPDFVARADEIAAICRTLDPGSAGARLVAVGGQAGVGKTALAVHTAHRLASRFPDGQLYAALRDADGRPADPADVLANLLRALGDHGSALPAGADARAGLFRARLAGRRVLLVLDDACGHRQVIPFAPPAGSAVLVTSRLPLTALPGATVVDLRPLDTPSALTLLGSVAGPERVRAEGRAAAELVEMCGGLPLAVRIAAARLAARPHWTIEALGEQLADERRRLDELRHVDLAVRPGLQLAFEALSPPAARGLALLGALRVPTFPGWPLAALLDVSPADGDRVLNELLDAHLLDSLGPDAAGQQRYGFHQLTRIFARERQESAIDSTEWTTALDRAASGWLALARHAQDHLRCERFYIDDRSQAAVVADPRVVARAVNQPVEWFEAEREAIAGVVNGCVEAGLTANAFAIAGTTADFYEARGHHDDWRRVMRVALVACQRAGEPAREAAILRGLGACMVELDDSPAAVETLRAARSLAEAVGDSAGAAMARSYIGVMLGLTGQLAEAETELRASVEQLRAVGRRQTEATALTSLSFVLRQQGRHDEAVDTARRSLHVARWCRDLFAHAYGLRGLAGALRSAGRPAEAQGAARQAASLFARMGDPIRSAQSLRILGESLAGEPTRSAEAQETLSEAAAVFDERGSAWGLALTDLTLGEVELARGDRRGVERLRRSLTYWTEKRVPAFRARALLALGHEAERAGDPGARQLLLEAYDLYRALDTPDAADLAEHLGL